MDNPTVVPMWFAKPEGVRPNNGFLGKHVRLVFVFLLIVTIGY